MQGAFDHNWLGLLLLAPFIGSFLGVLVLRLPTGEPVVRSRSRCEHCRHALGARDLVPVFSWLTSAGRCRHCAAAIGWFYPAMELAPCAVVLWAATAFSGWQLWAASGLGAALLTLAIIDMRHLLLPDVLTLPLVPAGLIVTTIVDRSGLIDHLIGAIAGFATFALVRAGYRWLRNREGLGLGDAKLMAAAGAWVSWHGLPGVLLIATLSALLALAVQSLAGRRIGSGNQLPFGTCICFAIWIVLLYGPVTLA